VDSLGRKSEDRFLSRTSATCMALIEAQPTVRAMESMPGSGRSSAPSLGERPQPLPRWSCW